MPSMNDARGCRNEESLRMVFSHEPRRWEQPTTVLTDAGAEMVDAIKNVHYEPVRPVCVAGTVSDQVNAKRRRTVPKTTG